MTAQQTKMIDATKVLIREVTVPEQELEPVRLAYDTARLLNGELAGFRDTAMSKVELGKAKGKYILAVAGAGLPETTGWYKVDRNSATFKSISETDADRLIKAGHWDEVLYVNQSAINAAKENRPVALYAFGGCLDAVGWSCSDARVALAKPQAAKMLRLAEAATLQVTFKNGKTQLLRHAIEAKFLEEQ